MDAGSVGVVYNLAKTIYMQVDQAKANKKQCARLAKRIKVMETAVRGLAPEQTHGLQYEQGLNELVNTLKDCLALTERFSQNSRWFYRLLKAGTHKADFERLSEELQQAAQVLMLGMVAQQVLNREEDKADQLEDARFIQQHRKEILKLNQETLEQVKVVGLRQQEQKELLYLQVASLKGRIEAMVQQDVPMHSDLKNTVSYYDLRFERKIAEGSFATVYQGFLEDHVVAIKTLRGTLTPTEAQRFTREVAIMSDLRHPQITMFYGACLEQGHACLVMEYMAQGALSKVLAEQGLSLEQKKFLALDVAKALYHLHQKNILHRDLKSSNVLINAAGVAKLSDFGLSKTAMKGVQTTYERSQTLQCQAPECFARGGHYTSASDIYSLGFILWEIMTGKTPAIPDSTQLEQYSALGERETLPDDLPAPIATLIKACWKVDPLERPSAKAFIQALEAYQIRPASPTAQQLYEEGRRCEVEGHFTPAFEGYQKAANKGHVKANTCAGVLLIQGKGVSVDKQGALAYFLSAAEGGDARAMYNAGRMYEKGDGIVEDRDQALLWYQKAADAGNQEARKKCETLQRVSCGL